MEDERLKDLFSSFEPELSPDYKFMRRLRRNMEAVELVKSHSAMVRRRNKVAVTVAAISGVMTGVILTLLFPLIESYIMAVPVAIPQISVSSINLGIEIAMWTSVAVVSAITAYNAYEITISRLSVKKAI